MVGRLLFCHPECMADRRDVTVSTPTDNQAEEMYKELLGDFLEMGQLPDEKIGREQAYVSVSAVHRKLRGMREFTKVGELWRC